jgi:6-phosphogluconolactonase
MKDGMLVYVGTYTEPIRFGTGKILEGKGEGIYRFRLNAATGGLTLDGVSRGVVNPSYLAFGSGGRFLYAVNELKTYDDQPTGTVSAFAVDPATGALEFLNKRLTHGTDPCHAVVDDTGQYLFVANFMSGSVCVLPIRDDGSLDEASDFIQHLGSGIDPVRQKGPHAHSVTLDRANRFAFVPDLGLDKLTVYRLDRTRGMLEPHTVPWIKGKPGAGPRHVAFHPNGKFGFLINELDSTITALSYDGRKGVFEALQVVPTLPSDFHGQSTCAEIQVSPGGGFLYGSNRGHDSIAIFRINPRTGRLAHVGCESTQGKTPRNFGIDPTGQFLLVANQDTDTVVTFRIDPRTGRLRPTGQIAQVPTPVCVKFLQRGKNARASGAVTKRR